MTTPTGWRARLMEHGFPGAAQVPCMHGAAVLRSLGELAAAEAALRELLGRHPEDEGALRALISLVTGEGRAEEAVALRRRLHARRCRELGIAESDRDAAIAYLEAAESGAAVPERAAEGYMTALFDDYAPRFDDKLRGALEYRGPEHILAAVREALGERSGLDVLDLGCGTGLAGVLLRPLARRLTGIDLSPGMLDRARARGVYDALRMAELTGALGASTESHELIVAVDVLIYFGALEPVFEGVARRLAPGGLFAFTVEKDEGQGYSLAPTGRYTHGLGYLRGCARAAGLEPVVEREAVLRTERSQPVQGHVVVLRAAATPAR